MVLYFSGTGNSQSVAIQVADKIADKDVVSINYHLKSGKKVTVQSERPLVFVAPTYCWRMPRVVERWIMETTFTGNQDAYFILTCTGGTGNATGYARRLCAKKNMRFRGLIPIYMPENYLAMFPTPDEEECQIIMKRAKPAIAMFARQIRSDQNFTGPIVTRGGRLQSSLVNPLFYALLVHDKGFAVSEGCISCGKCAARCPLNNIGMEEGKPVWKGNCTHCMACIGGCPVEAIEYKSKSQGQHRHFIMQDSLNEEHGKRLEQVTSQAPR